MRKIIYTSRAVVDFDDAALRALLSHSRERNSAADLSGFLVFAGGSFLQLLEGPAEAVEDTYARIASDPRHGDLRVLTDDRSTVRRFPDWAMGFDSPNDVELGAVLPGYRRSAFPLADPALVTDSAVAEALLAVHRGGV
jgi:hypothetical protein